MDNRPQTCVDCPAPVNFNLLFSQAWSSTIVEFDPNHREFRNHTSEYFVRGHHFYDETIQAKRVIDTGVIGNDQPQLFDILELFTTKKAYVIDLAAKTCKAFDINYPFIPATPPAFANFTGLTTIGTAGVDGLDLNQYEAHDAEHGASLYQTYTAKDCLPVRNDRFDEATGFHYEQHSVRLQNCFQIVVSPSLADHNFGICAGFRTAPSRFPLPRSCCCFSRVAGCRAQGGPHYLRRARYLL